MTRPLKSHVRDRGCAIMMQEIHNHVLDVTTHGARGQKISVPSWLKTHCVTPAYTHYDKYIRMACSQLQSYAGKMGEVMNSGMPTPQNLFTRTEEICIQELGMCYPPPPLPLALANANLGNKGKRKKGKHKKETKQRRQCAICRTVVADLHDVLTRKDSSWSGYLQKAHIHGTLDTVCPELPSRFPATEALRMMQNFCEQLVEEQEGDLPEVIKSSTTVAELDRRICQELTSSCQGQVKDAKRKKGGKNINRDDDERGSWVWKSPFATLRPPATAATARKKEEIDGRDVPKDHLTSAKKKTNKGEL